MALNLGVPQPTELKPRITVFGVGGAGGNGVNNMIDAGLEGVEFVVANTDAQALQLNRAENKIQLGAAMTQGLGAGARPDVGRGAAEETMDEILAHLDGAHMVFVTAGMGGGTGTGAAPVIAKAAKERGILTIGVVTKPFDFEGSKRMRMAEEGIAELQQYVDTQIIIPNQNLFRLANEKTTFADAFAMADNVLRSGVCGITDLMVMPGLINLDFADVKTVMEEMGKAMMGTGEAEGEGRAVHAADQAISNPLLDDVSMKGARGVLINITGGMDMTLFEVDEAANHIRKEVDTDANIIVGSTFNEAMEGRMRVSIVATGIDAEEDALGPQQGAGTRLHVVGKAQPQPMPARPATVTSAPVQPTRMEVSPARTTNAAAAATAQPVAQTTEDAFIAPEPVKVDKYGAGTAQAAPEPQHDEAQQVGLFDDAQAPAQPAAQAAPEQAPQPAAPAPVQQAAPAPEAPRKKPSFMERVAGLGLSRKSERRAHREDPALPQTTGRNDPPISAHPVAEQPAAPVMSDPAPASEPAPSAGGDDDLDIPAFLRRQAN